MSPPKVVIVGASSAPLGQSASWVSSVAAARPYIGDPKYALVMADTARLAGTLTRLDAVRLHAEAGGQVVVLLGTRYATALTWDTPGAVELPLPAMTSDLAALLGVPPPADDRPLVAVTSVQAADASPVTAWKRGYIWFNHHIGEFLVSGAHTQWPVPLDVSTPCEDETCPQGSVDAHEWSIACRLGFSAFIERFQVEDVWPTAHILEVELSGGVKFGGSTRGDFLHWIGGHQRVVAVELTGTCTECGAPAAFMSGKDSGDGPSALLERCVDHVRHHTFSVDDLTRRLAHIEWRRP